MHYRFNVAITSLQKTAYLNIYLHVVRMTLGTALPRPIGKFDYWRCMTASVFPASPANGRSRRNPCQLSTFRWISHSSG